MSQEESRNLVRTTFESDFDRDDFSGFIEKLLKNVNFTKSFQQSGGNIRRAFQDKVSSFERIGQFTDQNAKVVDILIVHLKKETTLERGRTSLRNFAADYLQSDRGIGKSAVLIAYLSENKQDWRFSFVTLEKTRELNEKGNYVLTVKKLTPARRYSFLVGKNENSHTAQKQFVDLLNSQSSPMVEQIEEAFKIEKVTKEFFERYKELFRTTHDELNEIKEQNEKVKAEFDAKNINLDDFAKKLLGQIVFLYFLQKKGWFGVERDKDWGTGDKHYLRNLFKTRDKYRKPNRPQNFFNDVLEPLFYSALAIQNEKDYVDQFYCRIPFLNGGLFEPLDNYDWQTVDIFLPDNLFSNNEKNKDGDIGTGVLDVFDRYNFTVNESEPTEIEVAVDPEMLGKVFENLLPENERHGKGTYYTPRVIVAYMCQQSLINYLSTNLPDIEKTDIEEFILHGSISAEYQSNPTKDHADKNLKPSIVENAKAIDKLLADVKVCDPAIGSGAFPVGLLHEIVKARENLISTKNVSSRTTYELKRHTIENSIYGVDLDSGAVEIAKLRLWLSLVVDEEDRNRIEALPNLDYKIMQGNSLLEEFRGISLVSDKLLEKPKDDSAEKLAEIKAEIDKLNKEIGAIGIKEGKNSPKIEIIRRDLIALYQRKDALAEQKSENQSGLFAEPKTVSNRLAELEKLHEDFKRETRANEKRALREKISRLEHAIISEHLAEIETDLKADIGKLRFDLSAEIINLREFLKKSDDTPKIKKLNRDLQNKQNELTNIQTAQTELAAMNFAKEKPFFLWKLQFSEIFRDNGGFDIVVANPPYIRHEEIKHLKPALERSFETYAGTADLFVYFYEEGWRLLKENGSLSFISSNSFLNSGFGEKLRGFLSGKSQMNEVIDFAETKVFDATTEPCIFSLTKTLPNENQVRCLKWNEDVSINEIGNQVLQSLFFIPQTNFGSDIWRLESPQVLRLLEKLQSKSKPLGEYVEGRFYRGIVTGLNEAFVVNRETRDRLIAEDASSAEILKPFLRGRDIKRWQVNSADLWLIKIESSSNKNHAWSKKPNAEAESIFSKTYSAIYNHLQNFRERLMERDDQGAYFWELRACIYWEEFEKPKIIYQDIARFYGMAWDDSGAFLANTCYFIPTDEKWLLGILLSKAMKFHVEKSLGSDEGGFIRLFSIHVGKFPIPEATAEQQNLIGKIVEYILHLKPNVDETDAPGKLMISYFEQIIDALCYELYLTDEIHAAGKEFFAPLEKENLPPIAEISGDKTAEIRRIFERLFHREHLIRQNIFFLDTIESVRIIEGKV